MGCAAELLPPSNTSREARVKETVMFWEYQYSQTHTPTYCACILYEGTNHARIGFGVGLGVCEGDLGVDFREGGFRCRFLGVRWIRDKRVRYAPCLMLVGEEEGWK